MIYINKKFFLLIFNKKFIHLNKNEFFYFFLLYLYIYKLYKYKTYNI